MYINPKCLIKHLGKFCIIMGFSMNNNLVEKFQALKQRQNELITEKAKCDAKLEQLMNEIKAIQNKYPEYDLSSIELVECIINDLNSKLENDLNKVSEQFNLLNSEQL